MNPDGRANSEEDKDRNRPQAPHAQSSSQCSASEGGHGCVIRVSGPEDTGSQAFPGSIGLQTPVGSGVAAALPQVPNVPGFCRGTSTTRSRLLGLLPFGGHPLQRLQKHREAKADICDSAA